MMKMKWKILCVTAAVCLIVCAVLTGCHSTDYESVYNDDLKIAKTSSSIRIASVQTSNANGYKMHCSSLSGVYVVSQSFHLNGNTEVTLSLNVNAGKLKVVLTNGETVYTLAEGTFDGKLDFEHIPNGTYKLKLVGVDADFELELKY